METSSLQPSNFAKKNILVRAVEILFAALAPNAWVFSVCSLYTLIRI